VGLLSAAAPASPKPSLAQALHPFVELIRATWWLWAIVVAILLARLARHVWNERQLRRSGIRDIDLMDGPTFERRLGHLFRALGYEVEHTGNVSGDYGCDLIVNRAGERSVIQAKRWKKKVGVRAVQEAVAARGYYGADGAIVVTNSHFTQQAQKLARANNVKLWERSDLVDALLKTSDANRQPPTAPAALAVASAGGAPALAPDEPAFCARCGNLVSPRVRSYCLAHTGRFRGLVYCYKHQRAL
jgi:restriction system protein